MSFQLPGGVSAAAEKALWRRGILTWADFIHRGFNVFSPQRSQRLLLAIRNAEHLLKTGHLNQWLKCRHPTWLLRLCPLLLPQAHFLDIETTGLRQEDLLVSVALVHQQSLRLFVRGTNLNELPSAWPSEGLLVTFYGKRFDLPRLRHHLGIGWCGAHLDLAPVLRKLGYGPGLKNVLAQLQCPRPPELPTSGKEIPSLWRQAEKGDRQALKRLLSYNVYDAAGLQWAWIAAYNRSLSACPLFRPLPPPKMEDFTKQLQEFLIGFSGAE
jgi:hypothetical protein